MTITHDLGTGQDFRHARGEASVAASGSTTLSTVVIPDGEAYHLERVLVDFKGSSLLSLDRGLFIRAKEDSDVQLTRAATGSSSSPPDVSSIVYRNETGSDVTVELHGFHGGTSSQTMIGHQTWRSLSKSL